MGIGSVCMKIAGRDAGKFCVIVDRMGGPFVLVDGQTRRKKCNTMHLEPLSFVADIKKGATSAEVATALKKKGIIVQERKTKAKRAKASTEESPSDKKIVKAGKK